ncbi:hypothetical protein [Erythrobacter alti]|uniref:hypothetical protein n=1 Tax=Erythrobacter alti TaxID=1896145 RepID=UPI0030F3C6AC
MSYKEGDEIHIDDDEASAGEKSGHMRWVLGLSLVAALAFMSIIWITGALSQGDTEEEATKSAVLEDAQDDGDDTDSILMEAGDEFENGIEDGEETTVTE